MNDKLTDSSLLRAIVQSPDENPDYETGEYYGSLHRKAIERSSPRGVASQALSNAFMGFNHRMAITPLPINREMGGFTFFTRTDMNFDVQNMKADRTFEEMILSPNESSDKAILAMLDPLCPYTANDPKILKLGAPLANGIPFDNKQAFMPILSNTLLSISGFPDNTLDFYTSEEGIKREQWKMVDSIDEVNYGFSLSAVFRNVDGDPISDIFTKWLRYTSNVYMGNMLARVINRIQRRKDYETGIYRLLTDPTGRFVTKYGKTIGIPSNNNMGAAMNFDVRTPFVTDANQINIQFECEGAEYNDPIIIEEFNNTVCMFNPDMLPTPGLSEYVPIGKDNMVKISRYELEIFNYYGYPYIDPITKELFWYVSIEEYQRVLDEVNGNV